MTPEVIAALKEEHQNEQVNDLLTRCRELLKLSRDEMRKYYDKWDANDMVYRGERDPDAQDKKASEKGEPIKMVIPLTYQQCQTFVSFLYQVYTQRPYFYELAGAGQEDCAPAKLGMATLERDLAYNRFKSEKLIEFLTNVARYGIGVIKHSWVHETLPVREQVPDPAYVPTPGVISQPPVVTQIRDVTKFMGNKIISLSPYKFFPDPRLPLTRFAEGEFCGSFDEFSRTDLEHMETNGEVAGMEFVEKWSKATDFEGRRVMLASPGLNNSGRASSVDDRFVIVDEIQIKLNPAKTEIAPGVFLDKEMDREVKYLIWIANDQRIIKAEPLSYLHGDFTYDVTQFTADQARFINFGLAELLGPLQDVTSWFINARITSVRKVINNFLVVDPSAIEFDDIKSRSPVIRIKKAFAGSGIDQHIKQLQLQDVTTNHLNDVNFLSGWAQDASGITDNLVGSFASGRRSATEAKNVSNNSASRLLLTAHSIWECALAPLGRKLLSNLRQGLDEKTLVQVYGALNSQADPQAVQSFIQVSKEDLVGNYDFVIFDGTQPGQRGYTAQALQELAMAMAEKPQLIFALGYDPKLLIKEILELRDVRNADRFGLTPQRAQELLLLAGASGNPGNAGKPGPAGNGPA